MLYVTNLKNL